jgi:hypothetical protein
MCLREPALEISLLDHEALKRARRSQWVEDRIATLVVDLDLRGQQLLAILVREQQDRLGDVSDLALDQARLVVVDQRDDVPAGDVAPVADDEPGRIEIQSNRPNAPTRDRRPDRSPPEHARKRQVVDVARRPCCLADPVLPFDALTDGSHQFAP